MKTILAMKNEDSALQDYEKSEDPAKITYSIPDFYDQDPTEFFQDLKRVCHQDC